MVFQSDLVTTVPFVFDDGCVKFDIAAVVNCDLLSDNFPFQWLIREKKIASQSEIIKYVSVQTNPKCYIELVV